MSQVSLPHMNQAHPLHQNENTLGTIHRCQIHCISASSIDQLQRRISCYEFTVTDVNGNQHTMYDYTLQGRFISVAVSLRLLLLLSPFLRDSLNHHTSKFPEELNVVQRSFSQTSHGHHFG